MIQMASLLAVAAVFIWLMGSNIYILKSEGGAYTRDNYLYAGTWAKSSGGLMCVGGGGVSVVMCLHYITVIH